MGALESKRWNELPPETPQKELCLHQDEIEDPRSPSLQYNRTPIEIQEYDESPKVLIAKAEFEDPRSPSMKISRTPLGLSKTEQENEEDDVFDAVNVEGVANPGFSSSKLDAQSSVPGVPLRIKEKVGLKNTTSPGDYKRKNRLRRQSLPQKLFSDKDSSLPRSPLAQRNQSMPDDKSVVTGKNKKFTFVHKKKSFLADKENSVEQLLL